MQLRRKLILTCRLQEIDIYPREHILWKHVSTDELMQFMIKEGSNVPRKGHIQKRDVLADPLYNNKVVTKLINNIMLDGKKGVAQKIVYGAFGRVEEKTGKPAVEVFEEAMNNIMPVLEVRQNVSVVLPIRCRSRLSRRDVRPWHFAGSPCSPVREARRPRKRDWQTRLWMQQTTLAHL